MRFSVLPCRNTVLTTVQLPLIPRRVTVERGHLARLWTIPAKNWSESSPLLILGLREDEMPIICLDLNDSCCVCAIFVNLILDTNYTVIPPVHMQF
jgi:hypothetical protein